MASTYTFSKLIAPTTKDAFLRDYWEKKPFLLHREDRTYYSELLTMRNLDDVLTQHVLAPNMAFIANASRQVEASEFTGVDGNVDPVRIFQQYADGGTIVFNQLHTLVPALAELCRSLEREINCRFQTNIYFTPPKAQGFPTHYDSHDVFVLQVHGVKHWTIYNAAAELPFKGQPFRRAEHKAGDVTMEFDLHPGDILYLPRGFMHDAQTREGETIHITLGALTTTWTELLLESIAKVALTDVDFRRSLPPGFANTGSDRNAAREHFKLLLEKLGRLADVDAALDHFADELVSSRRPLLLGQFEQLSKMQSLTVDARVGARPNLVYRWAKKDEQIIVSCHGSELRMPDFAAEPLLFALETPSFRIGDLPGELDDDGKVVLVKRLVREGLVAIEG